MAKNIDIGGRLHSVASGNVVTGANEILDDAEGKKQNVINAELKQAIIDSKINEAEATVDDGVGAPSATAEVIGQKLFLAFQNIMGDGIASIEQTTTSEESEGVNVVTVTTVGGKVCTFQIRNGAKGDTVILGEGVEYILYNGTGQNTDGAMTQAAVTKELYPLKGEYNAELEWGEGSYSWRKDAKLYGNFKSGDRVKIWFTGTGVAGKHIVVRYDDETTLIGEYSNNNEPVYVELTQDSNYLSVLVNNSYITTDGTFIAHIKYGYAIQLERDIEPKKGSLSLVESGGVYAHCKEDEEYLQSLAMRLRSSSNGNLTSAETIDNKYLNVDANGKAYIVDAVSSGFYRVYKYDLTGVTCKRLNIFAKPSQYTAAFAFFKSSNFTIGENVGIVHKRTESGVAEEKYFEVEIPDDAIYLLVQSTVSYVAEVATRVLPSEIIQGADLSSLLGQKSVRADVNQSLTDNEKARVWANIGLSNTNFYFLEYWGGQSADIIALSPGTYYYNTYYDEIGLKIAAAGTAGSIRMPIKKNDLCYYNGKFYISLDGSTLTDISSIIMQGFISQTKGTDTGKMMSQSALLPTILKADNILFDEETEEIELTPTIRNGEYVKADGDTNSHSSFKLYVYNIEGIVNELKIVGSESWQNPFYAFYSSSDLSKSTLLYVTDKGANETTVETFNNVIIPAGAKYLAVNKFGGYGARADKIVHIIGNPVKNVVHRLKGKKWACIGDSLTEVNQRTTKHYFDYIAEEIGIIPLNYGKSGTGYAKSYNTYTPFYDRIASIDETADVITIFGSFNDLGMLSSQFLIGTKTDTGTTTMAGCINTTVDNILARFPLARLGIISPTPWNTNHPGGASTNSNNYVAIIKEICEYRSIPFLDLWRCSNLRPWDTSFREIAYSKDEGNGVHPDENGHKLIAPMIRQFVESLI